MLWYHRFQVRKYLGIPYYVHCVEVAEILATVAGDDHEAIAAALLHDSVEDTQATEADLRCLLPERVVDLVMEVTEVSRPGDGNRAARKQMDLEHYASASPAGQSIKAADVISNLQGTLLHDPDFGRVYLRESQRLIDALMLANPRLRERASAMIDVGLRLSGSAKKEAREP